MIRVEGLCKRFRHQVVLDRVSLVVPDGSATAILGRSGIGKTVLLRIMAGLLRPDAGSVFYDDRPVRWGAFADNRAVTGGLGYVFQGGALFDSMSVAQNVALPLAEGLGLGPDEVRRRVATALELVGMAEHADLKPKALSGGMTRLVAIARAVVTEPRYVFYDEPTTGLDPVVRERILAQILKVKALNSRTQLVVTHDLDAARKVADRMYLLRDGRLEAAENVRKEDYEPTGA
jgi:phospholipid/cholesterol/gamma-HCH transport system ATP-binding protein